MSEPLCARRDVREATRLVLGGWRANLVYGVLAGLVLAVVLVPAISWVLLRALSVVAGGTVLNYDIASLVLSVPGLLLFVLWTILSALLVVVAQGGHAYTAAAVAARKSPRVGSIVLQVFRDLARVPGGGAVRLALLSALLTPLITTAVSALGGLILAPFQGSRLLDMMPSGPRFLAVAAVGLAVLGLGLYLYVRWSLAVPGLCLEGLSLKRATKRSAERTRAHFWPVARGHLLHHAVIAFLLGVASFVIGLLGRPIIQAAFDRSRDAGVLAVALLLVVAGAVLGAITLFGTARLVALMTIHHRKLGGKIAPDRIVAVQPLDQEQRQRLRYLVPGVLVILAATVIITLTSVEEELERTGHVTTVTAHRGSSIEAPQNSMAALLLAIDDGADACEFDVHQGKDGALVVIHDAHLQKLTGVDRHVYDMTLDELVQLDVGSHHDPKFASERLPTLEQYLRAAKGKIKLNVELKVHGKEAGDYAGDVIDLLRREGMLEDSYITSLDAAILRRVRKLEPTLPIGMIITAKVGDASNLDCDIYSVQPLIATSDFVNRAHREDREVHVWTINDAADMNLYADRNADSLITDLPRLAREVLEARTPTDELKAAVKRLFDVD